MSGPVFREGSELGYRTVRKETLHLQFATDSEVAEWMPLTSSFLCFNVKFLMGAHHLIRGIDNCTVP